MIYPRPIKSIATILFLLAPKLGLCATLIVFGNPHLVAIISGNRILGYYNTQHQILPLSCSFFFEETGRQSDSLVNINSFPMENGNYASRNKADDIRGRVFLKNNNNEWIIQTEEPQAGCGGAVGTFYKGPDDDHPTRYEVAKQLPAIGFRIVTKKTNLKNKNGANFKDRKGFLISGDVVTALESEGAFTRVRYVHPATGNITTAWINTTDLADPFASGVSEK